jgi:hypothetical protein
MNHLKDEPPVTVVDGRDHFATESSNVSLYQPKGEYRTSLQQHFPIPPTVYGPVRNHFIMASSVSANPVDRQRSLDMLHRMKDNGDEAAAIALTALDGLIIN